MDETEIRERLFKSLPHYAAACLKIRPKEGQGLRHFEFNQAQAYIHGRLEAQKEATGRVRALVLKGRQQGCSTYISARFYHRVTHTTGLRCFILTHADDATQNLFEMVTRFHDHVPELFKPSTGAASAKELSFDKLDSGYRVGTAGTKAVGRSATIQLLHGSEVAFWPHAETHRAGIIQAVPRASGTEIILESTANGVGGVFHEEWLRAESGKSEYQAIFVPWFWQEEYTAPVPKDFVLTAEEREYKQLWGLDDGRIFWRREKIEELRDPLLFKQEYPACAAEAFQLTGHDSFIPPGLVIKARKFKTDPIGPLVIGYDPAWTGGDSHAMAFRKGRVILRVERRKGLDTMQGAGWAKHVIDQYKPAKMFIDVGGVGAGIYDRLNEMGYDDTVVAVNFGSKPFEPYGGGGGPANRRAEMWMKSRDWLADVAGVQIPDDDGLQADACGPAYTYNSNSEVVLEKKADMRKRGVPSPDMWDAVALTFAEPVAEPSFSRGDDDGYFFQRESSRSGVTGY